MSWGKDRAPPGSVSTRAQFPFPNRPVPPPRMSHKVGPQAQTYAAVVRQNMPQPDNKTDQVGNKRTEQVRKQPADPHFGQLVRKMHAVIKIVHHLQNVAVKPGKAEPRMISRMVNVLATMIKPASPTASTTDWIRGNANNWGYNTLLILEEHYKKELDKVLEDLSKIMVQDWKPAFQVATRWARRNLPHIAQDAIDHAEALIASSGQMQMEAAIPHQPPVAQHPPQPQPPFQQQPPVPQAPLPQRPRVSQGGETHQTHTPQLAANMVEEPLHPVPGLLPRQQARAARQVETRGCVITEDSRLLDIEEEDPRVRDGQRQDAGWSPLLFDIDISGEEERDGSTILTPIPVGATPLHVDNTVQQQRVLIHRDGDGVADGYQREITPDHTSTPTTQRFRVTRHINTERKMIDWNLTVGRKWLIVGDSNLSRIPGHVIQDLQIDSYPGANFRHAQALMAKATSQVTVEKVVLAFGLNCRGQKARETSVKQLQGAVRAARRKFPYADIWVPQINFSSSLPTEEKNTLNVLNHHIIKNMPFIPALQDSDFFTGSDNVHWTRETAKKMLDHWATCLNLNAQ